MNDRSGDLYSRCGRSLVMGLRCLLQWWTRPGFGRLQRMHGIFRSTTTTTGDASINFTKNKAKLSEWPPYAEWTTTVGCFVENCYNVIVTECSSGVLLGWLHGLRWPAGNRLAFYVVWKLALLHAETFRNVCNPVVATVRFFCTFYGQG